MSARRWTAADLVALKACDEQVALFRATFPDGATADDTPTAVRAGLDVEWLVRRVCAPDVVAAFDAQVAPLRAAYDAQVAPLWAAALQTVEAA